MRGLPRTASRAGQARRRANHGNIGAEVRVILVRGVVGGAAGVGPSQSSGDRKRRVVTGWPCALCGTREPLYSLKLEKTSRRPPMRWKTGWRGGESRRQEEKAGWTHTAQPGGSPRGPCGPGRAWHGRGHFWAARMERDWLTFTMAMMRRPLVSRKVGQKR